MRDPESVRQFKKLYQEYFRQIYNYIYKRVSGLQDTEDIVSETFTAVWANLDQLDPERNSRSWVYGIAVHKLNDFLRKRYRLDLAPLNEQISAQDENVYSGNSGNAVRLLDGLLQELTEDERKLINLRYQRSLPYSEVAKELDITEDNAKVKAGRIVTKLKKLWIQKAQKN
jgi:RNA polymerase sigma-70 factor (ECF subfamily)